MLNILKRKMCAVESYLLMKKPMVPNTQRWPPPSTTLPHFLMLKAPMRQHALCTNER